VKFPKFYFQIDTTREAKKGFKKYAYQIINDKRNLTSVHYIGDNNLAEDFSHQIAKQEQPLLVPYHPTLNLTKVIEQGNCGIQKKKLLC